jgi:bacillithiol biosynthesis cysteine-adding enzyme BshC
MVHRIALRDIPSTSGLIKDSFEGKDGLRALVPRHFLSAHSFAEQAELVAAAPRDRAALSAALREQNQRFGAGADAMEGIDRLAEPSSLAVIGGQQAGLFGGPLYTVHKALTILVLARRLSKDLARPVVPVFWIASEDSDLAEVDRAFLTDRDGRLRMLRLPGDEGAKLPLSAVRLGEGIDGLCRELAECLGDGAHAEEILAEVRAAYTAGRTYPQAFGSWMAGLFRGQGLVLVDPSDVVLKRLAYGLFEREIMEQSPVSAAVREQTLRMEKAGYRPQIELRDGYLTLFHQDPARDTLARRGNGWELKSSGKRFSPKELAASLAEHPERFSPNAVLRPLFQDTIFPTLAVVLGPSEVAYFTQLTLAYAKMGIPMPVIVPRASLTLIEPRMARLMEGLGIDLAHVLRRGERVIDDILARHVPPSLAARIEEGRPRLRAEWAGITEEVGRLDPTLRPTSEIAASRALRQFDFMEKKILRSARRKDEILRGKVGRLAASLAPRGGMQERTLCALPFLARHGRRWLADAMAAIDPFVAEHRGVEVGS